MIFLTGDYDDIDKELDRIGHMPNRKTSLLLDTVLAAGFKETQAATHVITGSLKGSGKKNSEVHGDKWEGEIKYGGPSTGINNPVNYAIYEKRREGAHDFMTPTKAMGPQFVAAMLAGMRKSS